jgi:hypothetical protein
MKREGSTTVVYAALGGNLAIAVTKFGAALYTGSSAMFTEALHSLVDTVDQGADSDGSRPPIPTRSRPAFRFDVGHHSEMKPATR